MNPMIYRNALGEYHRDGGLPAIEWDNGNKSWYVNGVYHRDGGLPAIDWVIEDWTSYNSEYKEWYVNGLRHREGGLPAIKYFCGENLRLEEWWINDIKLSDAQAIRYALFCQKMQEKKLAKAQKKIYFWWIQICYDLNHPSGCGKRMAQRNLEEFETMMK